MKKIAVILCTLGLLLSGCSEEIKDYERSTSPGNLETIHLDEVYKKFENEETFTLLITQTTCYHCQEMFKKLAPYLRTHNVLIYDLILDKEGISSQAAWDEMTDELNKYVKDFSGTPALYYIEDGKKKDEIIGWGADENGKNEINIDTYDTLVRRHQLDAVNK